MNSGVLVRASVYTYETYKYLIVLCLLCIINSSSMCFNTNCVTYGHLVLFTLVLVAVKMPCIRYDSFVKLTFSSNCVIFGYLEV